MAKLNQIDKLRCLGWIQVERSSKAAGCTNKTSFGPLILEKISTLRSKAPSFQIFHSCYLGIIRVGTGAEFPGLGPTRSHSSPARPGTARPGPDNGFETSTNFCELDLIPILFVLHLSKYMPGPVTTLGTMYSEKSSWVKAFRLDPLSSSRHISTRLHYSNNSWLHAVSCAKTGQHLTFYVLVLFRWAILQIIYCLCLRSLTQKTRSAKTGTCNYVRSVWNKVISSYQTFCGPECKKKNNKKHAHRRNFPILTA